MAWIKNGQVFEIIQGFSLENTKRNLRDHLNRDWKLENAENRWF